MSPHEAKRVVEPPVGPVVGQAVSLVRPVVQAASEVVV